MPIRSFPADSLPLTNCVKPNLERISTAQLVESASGIGGLLAPFREEPARQIFAKNGSRLSFRNLPRCWFWAVRKQNSITRFGLAVLEKIGQRKKLKALVPDSVSSPIYETRAQHGAERVHGVVPADAATRFH
jgi:hypothetical protein